MSTTRQDDLISRLRVEADSLKDCFTRFSFQAIAFSALVFGLLGRGGTPESLLVVATVFVVTMLLAVARIGTYKYGNSNLLHGYELHLERTKNLTDTPDGWKDSMRGIGWEEARRAWRVVQTTTFRHLYYYHPLIPNLLRQCHRQVQREYRWFEPSTLVGTAGVDACYHPGGYLRLMITMLHLLSLLATLPLWLLAADLINRDVATGPPVALITAAVVLFIAFRALQDYPRLWLLEDGLLSIHSCAVMWQAVVLAHYRALEAVRAGGGRGYESYTKNLALQAHDLKGKLFRIDTWIGY